MSLLRVKQFWQQLIPASTTTESAAVESGSSRLNSTDTDFWPEAKNFLELASTRQLTDGRVCCLKVAVCDETGLSTQRFQQGQSAHFFIEFEILEEIGVPVVELEFQDANLLTVYGKNTFQFDLGAASTIKPGDRLRYHQVVTLDIQPGLYFYSAGLLSCDKAVYERYQQDELDDEQLQRLIQPHCRLVNIASFEVGPALKDKLRYYGIANLPGRCSLRVEQSERPRTPAVRRPDLTNPAIFHITHYKAGSQWLYKIFLKCVPDSIVPPQTNNVQFFRWPPQPGKIYPTVYVTHEQFYSVALPPNWRHFVIIRDLRDTLVSAYFSIKVSHRIGAAILAKTRDHLNRLSLEEGLLHLMASWLPISFEIQLSWVEAGEAFIRYEDLLQDDIGILEQVLLDQCELPVSREKFRQAVLANRFENLTKGRQRGQEDIASHERKGIVGDWRNYFSDRVKQAFKARYGGLLVAAGYEKDLNW